MDTSELTNLPVAEKLKLVTKLWDEIAASDEPISLPDEVVAEISQRSVEATANPTMLIDDEEMWKRVDG